MVNSRWIRTRLNVTVPMRLMVIPAFFILLFNLLFFPCLNAQPGIKGKIDLDTTRWAPMAYLSKIPDFTQLYLVSSEVIINRVKIDRNGNFFFDIKDLSAEEHIYRIHFSKQGDPATSLIIGGIDENHVFLIASNQSDIGIRIRGGHNLIGRVTFSGYLPNKALQEINQLTGFLDTLDFYGPAVNRDFVRQAVYDKLRQYADTCTNPLISLYALYHSRFESDFPKNKAYYKNYLRKWKKEDSEYFKAFRAQIPIKEGPDMLPFLIFGLVIVLAGAGVFIFRRMKRKQGKNQYQLLTVQERKIFGLLKDGRSNKEISEEFGIGLSTVKSHVNSIYTKLNISSRTDVMDFEG